MLMAYKLSWVDVYLNRDSVQNNINLVLNKERSIAPGFSKLLFSTCSPWAGKDDVCVFFYVDIFFVWNAKVSSIQFNVFDLAGDLISASWPAMSQFILLLCFIFTI